MCGIFFAISRTSPVDVHAQDLERLKARGPDSLVIHHVTVTTASQPFYLSFASSVLNLRGDQVCVQPLIDFHSGSVFCWNGEAWKLDDNEIYENDSDLVFKALLHALSDAPMRTATNKQSRCDILLGLLTRITGPYAFVFYDAHTFTVYYGRDRLGRRSLNMAIQSTGLATAGVGLVTVSSTSAQGRITTSEVTTLGVHSINLLNLDAEPALLHWPSPTQTINHQVPDDPPPNLPSAEALHKLDQALTESLRLRILRIPTYNMTGSGVENPSKLAILFSGGLDCTLLARLCHDILPKDQSIDLLNVAFENPRTVRAAAAVRKKHYAETSNPYETCPDRMTGRSSYKELNTVCTGRTWRFVAIDVPYAEALEHRPTIIDLVRPHNTEMDLSIAMALYFAARGQGAVDGMLECPQSVPYTTPARVLLSGLGADELFGGYARHAAAFSRGGWQSLIDELELDFTRIGSRNLGRDDRVMSHWAREVRYPYLDEDFTQLALSLPVGEKCGFRSGKQVPKHFEDVSKEAVQQPEDLDPAKLILRCLAWQKGMQGVAAEKKRAIQFGARTAKMEGGRTKGTDTLAA